MTKRKGGGGNPTGDLTRISQGTSQEPGERCFLILCVSASCRGQPCHCIASFCSQQEAAQSWVMPPTGQRNQPRLAVWKAFPIYGVFINQNCSAARPILVTAGLCDASVLQPPPRPIVSCGFWWLKDAATGFGLGTQGLARRLHTRLQLPQPRFSCELSSTRRRCS